MAKPYADLKRLRVTPETRAWLQAEATETDSSQQDVARDALHEIALAKIRAARVLVALSPVEGHVRDAEGRRR